MSDITATPKAELQLAPCFKMNTKGLQITGDPTYEEWAAVGETLRFLEGAIQFAIGDWLRYGEHRWGEMYANAVEETGYSEGTLRNFVSVANSVDLSRRRDKLSFEHHKEVASLRLPDGAPDAEKQEQYLALAEEKELSRAKLRQVIKQDKRAAKEATRPHPSPAAIMPTLIVGRAESLAIDSETVDLIITSPPYNLGSSLMPMGGNGRTPRGAGIGYDDDMPEMLYQKWQLNVLAELYRVAKQGASLFFNHKVRNRDGVALHPVEWILCSDWTLRQEIVWWRKSTHNHNSAYFYPEDERIYWLTKGKPTLPDHSIGTSTVWEEFGAIPNTWHPAPFTEALPRMVINAVGREGITVLDPFAGSCTTVKVALEFGYQAIGVDINRDYLNKACEVHGWTNEI